MEQKKILLDKCLYMYYYSEWNLAASNFLLAAWLNDMDMPYSKLYILTELCANDVKFISVDTFKVYIHMVP